MEPTLPPNLPQALAEVAFVNGQEAAWEQKDCLRVIAWLSENGYTLLGSELWAIRDGRVSTAISTKAGPAIYAYSCDPIKGETWENYVQRSAREVADNVGAFCWPEDSLEPPGPAYFNLCWTDREWFSTENAKHTFDK